jgi:uridine kinase
VRATEGQEPRRVSDISAIAAEVRSLSRQLGPAPVVGISGYGGAGKTMLARALSEQLPGSLIVTGDEYLLERPPTTRCDDWSCLDRLRLLDDVRATASGGSVVQVVEGLGLFHPDLIEHFDLRIWIDVDLETATEQGMWRDEQIWHNPQTQLWLDIWKPNDADFFRRFRPDLSAHIVYARDPSATDHQPAGDHGC